MYFIPPFVKESQKNDGLYVSSPLYDNVIFLEENYCQQYFKIKKEACSDLKGELASFLHEQSFLFSKEELEKELITIKEKMTHSLQIIFMPTEACNFRCPYCYESHENVTMSPVLVEKIKEFIEQKIDNQDISYISISWFGGEPTLCSEYILDVNTFVSEKIKNKDISFSSSMTTNGFLLNIDSFKKYYNCGVTNYQITLDGWNHDKTRPLASGKGSLQVILDNLKNISALPSDYNFSIMIRHNILNGDEDYTWYDYLKELFGNDKRFSVLIRPVGDMGGESVKQLDLVKDNSLVERHAKYVSSIGMICKNDSMDHSSKPGQKVCYASLPNSYIFRADGRIHKCTVALDSPANCIGVVDEQKGVVIDEKKHKLWYEESILEKCYHCPEVLSCLNKVCPRNRLIRNCEYSCNLK